MLKLKELENQENDLYWNQGSEQTGRDEQNNTVVVSDYQNHDVRIVFILCVRIFFVIIRD